MSCLPICLAGCLFICHKMYSREENKTYNLFLFAGCKDLATPLSCTPRFIYKTAVNCEKKFLKNFMGSEKPNCGYVILWIIVFVYRFLCLGKPSMAANGRTMMQLAKKLKV